MRSFCTQAYQAARTAALKLHGLRYWSCLGSPRSPTPNLGITYASERMADGAGAQLFRTYGIYALSRLLGISYVHTPLQRLSYHGIVAFQNNELDSGLMQRYNDIFSIRSDIDVPKNATHHVIDTADLGVLSRLKARAIYTGEFHLARIVSPFRITDTYPHCYESLRGISPFPAESSRPIRIAVHVRRGDLLFRESHRLLSIDYYLNVIRHLEQIFDDMGLERRYELYTELPTQPSPDQPGRHPSASSALDAIDADAEAGAIARFDAVPNLTKFINTDPIEAMQRMATANVVVISHSAFSYLPALLNVSGAIIYHRFWHNPLRDWVIANDQGWFAKHTFVRSLERGLTD